MGFTAVPQGRRTAVGVAAAVTAVVTAVATPAWAAPGVDPATVDRSADPGATIGISKVVSTPPIPPNPDVVLLVDTTGSMGAAIANVRTNLQQVINNVRGAQPSAQFAVASYRDEGDGAELFRVRQDLTGDATALQNAVDGLAAGGGGDVPEAWVNGLFQVSDGGIAYAPAAAGSWCWSATRPATTRAPGTPWRRPPPRCRPTTPACSRSTSPAGAAA
ncbi:vWA domain-containing protein [Micromonospora sp. NPDC005305]|uniref:vWA domain-containing protein n=1 Tax=Micromonospora sp. NPDC005305 TaxID=3156875 RepID=UPI0033A25E4E